MSGTPLALTPGQVRAGDRVLVNGSWWGVALVGAACLTKPNGTAFHNLRLVADGDVLVIRRDADHRLTVDRAAS